MLPVVAVVAGFLLLLLVDVIWVKPKANMAAWISAATLATSGIAVYWMWTRGGTAASVYFGSFVGDRFSLFVDAVVLISALLVVAIAPSYLERRELGGTEFYSLVLAATAGMMLLAGATSLMVIFLSIELLSLALYVLSGFAAGEKRSQEAGMKYLLLGSFASAVLLFGMALVYGQTGHTQLEGIAGSIHQLHQLDPLLIAGAILMLVGFAFKVSAAPFHAWTPDVYQGAPVAVTAFMSVATKVAAFAVLIRVFVYTFSDLSAQWFAFIAVIAIFSMVIGNVAALTQNSVKRMLAYSGIAQAGYMLIGVAVSSSGGISAALYYFVAYALMNIGAFAVVTVLSNRGEDLDSYDSLKGLAWRHPYVAALMGLFMLSLAGFPPTAGFIGKLLVFTAAVHQGELVLALWGVATSAVSVFYYLKIVLLMYSQSKGKEYGWAEVTPGGALTLAVTGVGTIGLAIFAAAAIGLAQAAATGAIPAHLSLSPF
jgi:NADH-quinone oxidoreductase subunit N